MAKIAGIELCRSYNRQYGTDYIAVMPTNLYGSHDNFDLKAGHLVPALIRRFHEAKVSDAFAVVVWGTGSPVREFLYVDDLAAACLFMMRHYSGSDIVNIGTGQGTTIKELALLVKEIVGYTGKIVFDTTKPDGTPVKITAVDRISRLVGRRRSDWRRGSGGRTAGIWKTAQAVGNHVSPRAPCHPLSSAEIEDYFLPNANNVQSPLNIING